MKRKLKRELLEWGAFILLFGIIYFSGWHTEVLGRLQQIVLSTGIISPNTVEETKKANYDFSLLDTKGHEIPFKELEGEVIFLNFWATWCPPCIAEMPDINDLYSKVKDESKFVMISVDKDRQKAIDFVERKGFDFPIYFLHSQLPSTFDVHSIPATYLIDPRGDIRVENHGMAKYDTEKFRGLMSELLELQ